MSKLSALAVVAILSFVEAKHCTHITIPVTLNARNGIFNLPPLTDHIAVTKFAQDFLRRGQNYTAAVLQGYTTITDQYSIAATACRPDHHGENYDTWQFLTHGIGFDSGYWDLAFESSKYSYVDVAVDQYGYSTLAIDRLGIGQSSQADPTNVIQAPAELSAIYEVTKMLRAASLPDLEMSEPSHVIHVGHSFGAILSYELAAAHPNITDGLILQGFSVDPSYLPQTIAGFNIQAASNQILRWFTHTPAGYFTWSNINANQFAFLAPPYYDPLVGDFTEHTKQPFTTGEILTLGSQPSSAPDFTGPVLVLIGNEDAIYCGGDCSNGQGASIPAGVSAVFPKASAFEAYIQPNCGHAVNVHYNATGAYDVMNSFLNAHGF
ncbi:Ctr copper transporter family protein [Rutstroemia sp. NJR-2017a WRK4]|nr:Ctr copper transporter family protein [Rutstroemia sp. NJR-2017a WRK4]